MNRRHTRTGRVHIGLACHVLLVGSVAWVSSAVAQEAEQPEPPARQPSVQSQEPGIPPFEFDDWGRPLSPQLQRDFARPDPRLPWGYRQYSQPHSQSFDPTRGYPYPDDRYDRHSWQRPPEHSYDYGYGNYYRYYPPRDGYGDPYAFIYEEAYRRGVDDGRRFEQFERQAELGLASYLQAMENGLRAFGRHAYSGAARSFILAARLNQGDAASRIHAAHAMFALGRYHEAIPFLRRAFELQPRIAQLPLDMRDDYSERKDFTNRLNSLTQAAGASPKDADLWFLLGYCHMYSGSPAEAYRALKTAAELRREDRLIQALLEVAKLSAPVSPAERK